MTFTVDAYPDDLFEGTVTQVRLSPTTESNVVTYEVVVGASNPDHKLIPGLTANLTIYVMSEKDVLQLPAGAFNFEPEEYPEAKNLPQPGQPVDRSKLAADEKSVWVLEGDKLVNKVVRIGAGNGIKTSILSGLKAGELVATGYDDAPVGKSGDMASDKQSPFAPQPPGRNKKK